MSTSSKGSCLCGEVTYEVEGEAKLFQYCRCSRCRKTTGSAHASIMFIPAEGFRWTSGEDKVAQFMLPEAKYFGTAFCTRCGSAMPWKMRGGETVAVPAGGLDEPTANRPNQSIFCASGADWYIDPASLPQHDALPGKG